MAVEPHAAGFCGSLLAAWGSVGLVLGSTQLGGAVASAGGVGASAVSSGAVLGASTASVLDCFV